jgi:hypothetical protein
VYPIDGDKLVCPACTTPFRRRDPHGTPDQLPNFFVNIDMGTSRVRTSGSAGGKQRAVLDSPLMTRPVCSIDPENLQVHFEPRCGKDIVVIKPLKRLVCGDARAISQVEGSGIEVQEVLRSFCRAVLDSIREEFQNEIKDLDAVHITFAVACPAGLGVELQNVLLNAMLASAAHVTPTLLNEAEMGYMGGMSDCQLDKGTKALSLDIGGYTAASTFASSVNQFLTWQQDIMLATHVAALVCKPYRLMSVYCGTDWALDQLTKWILDRPEVGNEESKIRAEVHQFWNDTLKGVWHLCCDSVWRRRAKRGSPPRPLGNCETFIEQ